MRKHIQSAERVSASDVSDNYVFQRSQLAYHHAAEIISGDVLEIGTGSGYGVSIISPRAKTFITMDKFQPKVDLSQYDNIEFHQTIVPPLKGISSTSVDFVICFQVIEHIKDDFAFIAEVYRVLRHGGKFIVSTPNKNMSLTRNPWHIREYSVDEFKNLLTSKFEDVKAEGVFGNQKIMDYYEKNRKSVGKISKLDIFDIQHKAPRWALKIPYDILNRLNRRKLLIYNRRLTSSISMNDYYFSQADDTCFDLYFTATKS